VGFKFNYMGNVNVFRFGMLFFAFILFSCNPQKKIAGNYTYKTECLGIEMDGTQTVKAWGNGRNRFDATEQAKKNALNDVFLMVFMKVSRIVKSVPY